MANSYTQIHIQYVIAVKFREALILQLWKEHLHQFITGIVQQNDHKMLQINSMPDHLHMLLGMRPNQSVSSLIQNIKSESTKFLKQNNYCSQFAWQEGYGAFSYSKNQIDNVAGYIKKQAEHHKNITFLEEYKKMLAESDIHFEDRYIFTQPQ